MKKTKLLKKVEVDFTLFIVILAILVIGVIMVYSASSYSALNNPAIHDDMYYFKKQLIAAFLGLFLMLVIEKIDYHKIKKYTNIILIITFVLLILVVLIGPSINGAKRWINVGPLGQLQPSEIAKYAIVLLLAKGIEKTGERIKKFSTVIVYLFVAAFFAGMVYIEKNLSIASVIMIVSIIIIYVGGAKWQYIAALIGSLLPIGLVFIYAEAYRINRLMTFLNPWQDPKGKGYQIIQSFYALGSGGILGLGFGQSRQKCYYIPEPHNDFIFAIIGEELGLIGCVFIIILFLIMIQRGISIAMNAKDTYGTLLAVGITSVIAIQAIINIAVVTGSMPVTGVPLPFISYGGSSLLFNLMAMGILLNISSQKERK